MGLDLHRVTDFPDRGGNVLIAEPLTRDGDISGIQVDLNALGPLHLTDLFLDRGLGVFAGHALNNVIFGHRET